jgi:nitrite reductase/ring-hydroxylating ferredoxin subunit
MAGENWVKVASRSALDEGEVTEATIGDKEIAVYNVDGEFYATDNICTHAFARLSEGWLDGDVIECPLHAGRFEVTTGKVVAPPVTCDLKTYPVRISGDDVEVNLDA